MSRQPLPFHVPSIGDDEIESVVETLRSGWLTTGPKVKQFEERFGEFVGARHAVAVASGTAALHLALEAIGIKQDDEVLIPTMTFTSTAAVAIHLKARAVLVDCLPDTMNMDPDKIEKAITPKTRAIIPVDFAGQPCDYGKIREISSAHNLPIVEDAAHALPARFCGEMVGTIADITCFSFYATKTLATGEGGMATTSNPEWAERMRMMSLHGISKDAWKRYTAEGSWYYEVYAPGYKYNLTDIAAALGLEQLKKCMAFWNARQQIAERYDTGLADVHEVRTPVTKPDVRHARHLYVIQLELDRLRIGRNEFIGELKKKGVGTSVHFIPLHLHPYYRETYGYKPQDLPVASAVYERIISLPIYPGMLQSDVEFVIDSVREIATRYRR